MRLKRAAEIDCLRIDRAKVARRPGAGERRVSRRYGRSEVDGVAQVGGGGRQTVPCACAGSVARAKWRSVRGRRVDAGIAFERKARIGWRAGAGETGAIPR